MNMGQANQTQSSLPAHSAVSVPMLGRSGRGRPCIVTGASAACPPALRDELFGRSSRKESSSSFDQGPSEQVVEFHRVGVYQSVSLLQVLLAAVFLGSITALYPSQQSADSIPQRRHLCCCCSAAAAAPFPPLHTHRRGLDPSCCCTDPSRCCPAQPAPNALHPRGGV